MTIPLIIVAAAFAWAALAGLGMRWARPRLYCGGACYSGAARCGKRFSSGWRPACPKCDTLKVVALFPPLWIPAGLAMLCFRVLRKVYELARGPEPIDADAE